MKTIEESWQEHLAYGRDYSAEPLSVRAAIKAAWLAGYMSCFTSIGADDFDPAEAARQVFAAYAALEGSVDERIATLRAELGGSGD